jgi:phospholipid-binding lipoprotein MlaA
MSGNLVRQIADEPTRNALTVLNVVNTRANLLQAGTMLNEAALDKYSFMRDLYLQRRRNQLYDGNPPDEEETVETPPDSPPTPSAPSAPSTPPTEEKAP